MCSNCTVSTGSARIRDPWRCSLLIRDRGRKTVVCPRKLEIEGSVAELSQKHLQRMKDYQVRVVQEDTEAIVPKEARVCIGWTGLKHKTTKDRGRGKATVSFWCSTLHRHDDDDGLENGAT